MILLAKAGITMVLIGLVLMPVAMMVADHMPEYLLSVPPIAVGTGLGILLIPLLGLLWRSDK
jgi:hypothetical protein